MSKKVAVVSYVRELGLRLGVRLSHNNRDAASLLSATISAYPWLQTTVLFTNWYGLLCYFTDRAPEAQLVERRAAMREVVSSTPAGPTLKVFK